MSRLNKEELFMLLDIEEAADFQYFENLAALLECEEEIEEAVLFDLVNNIDKATFSELVHNYFEEMTDFLPADSVELFTLLDHIKFSLMGLAGSSGEENVLINLADEINRFRKWYSAESKVYCVPLGQGEEKEMPLRDAVVSARVEKLTGDKYQYDFSDCLDYPLDEYIMSFGDLIAAAEAEGFEDSEDSTED